MNANEPVCLPYASAASRITKRVNKFNGIGIKIR